VAITITPARSSISLGSLSSEMPLPPATVTHLPHFVQLFQSIAGSAG
jgi:hypothetical protein